MDILNNLGIGYTGDYLMQGSQIDKCKKSSQLDIKYTEFCVKIDGKENFYNQISNYYFGKSSKVISDGNLLFLPFEYFWLNNKIKLFN